MISARIVVGKINPQWVSNRLLKMFEGAWCDQANRILSKGPLGNRYWKAGSGWKRGQYYINRAAGKYAEPKEEKKNAG